MGTHIEAEIVAAFVDERDGGNLAGVVLDRPDLDEATMQATAARLGLSETGFVTAADGGFRFDVFTPVVRVPDCGHATVAAFGRLAQRGRFTETTTKYTLAGPRMIRAYGDGGIYMLQPAATFSAGPDAHHVAASLGLSEMTAFAFPPALARHDVAFIIVALPFPGMLAALIPNMRAIEAICASAGALGYYVYATAEADDSAQARMFGPLIGIPEESATGMAAGLLAAYLHDVAKRTATSFAFDQGLLMDPPSPSRLNARLDIRDGTLIGVWVGGNARLRSVETLDV